jgi:hypothetical protein
MRTIDYYRGLEESIRALLVKLRTVLSPEETNEVEGFLDAGEYGIALETLCWMLRTENKFVSAEVVDGISKLAERMELDSSIWTALAARSGD